MASWLVDIYAVCPSKHAPDVRGWWEDLCKRSLQRQDIFTKALHKGLLMMKTMMASAWVEVEEKAGRSGPA